MQHAIHIASLCGLTALLVWAAVGDMRHRIIPNWLNASIALLSIPYWLSAGLPLWPLLAEQLGLALVTFLLFAGLFQLGQMGGGDVKLFAALALWLPLMALIDMLIVVALAGGVLTIVLLVRHHLARAEGRLEIPYGVAIVVGALLVLGEPIIKQLAG